MKRLLALLCLSGLLFPLQSHAYQFDAYGTTAQSCYAKAMVGMDSVINARAGLVPEHVLDLARKTGTANDQNSTYHTDTLIVMLDAYLWQETPHSYALQVFFNCAANSGPPLHSAQAKLP